MVMKMKDFAKPVITAAAAAKEKALIIALFVLTLRITYSLIIHVQATVWTKASSKMKQIKNVKDVTYHANLVHSILHTALHALTRSYWDWKIIVVEIIAYILISTKNCLNGYAKTVILVVQPALAQAKANAWAAMTARIISTTTILATNIVWMSTTTNLALIKLVLDATTLAELVMI